jgi:hypothetical protein
LPGTSQVLSACTQPLDYGVLFMSLQHPVGLLTKFCCAVGQFFLSPILLWKSVFSAIISSLLYVSAISYYHYMNFLGYSALPFLEHTELFMWPVPVCVLLLPFLLLVGLNPSRLMLGLFFQ